MKKLILASKAGDIIHRTRRFFDKNFSEMILSVIVTAANVYDEKPWFYKDLEGFEKAGFNIVEFDLVDKTEEEVRNHLSNIDAVFVSGGNTYYLLEHVRKSGFGKVIKERIEDGLIYIGSSAGSILVNPTIDHARRIDDPNKANSNDYSGLGLVDFLVLPHFGRGKYAEQMQKIVDDWQGKSYSILGITDEQALLVTDDLVQII